MRLLIIDPAGAALDFAIRAQAEGHHVKHFIRQAEKTKCIGRGFVDLVEDHKKWLLWADLVFNADNTRYLRDLDASRLMGANIIGATQESAEWELDREVGMEVLRKAGIATPSYKQFNDYDKAIAYVKKEDRRFVSKPSGDADKALSYVAKSPEDLCYMLERWKKTAKLNSPFLLQEFVEGIEMAVGGWHGPQGFIAGWCENFEFKKLMDGDMGVATGEQGTVLRYVRKSKLAGQVLVPLEKALNRVNYVGYVDVNCILDDEGIAWPLEFTMRPGWPTFNIQQELHKDTAQWLLALTKGEDSKPFALDTIAIGVVLSVPDYPYSHLTRKEVVGSPIYGIKPSTWRHLHACEMMMGEAPCRTENGIEMQAIPVTAGDYVLVMSATGETVLGAKDTCYSRLKRLKVPNSPMWRTDIGDRLGRQLPKLQEMGFATNMAFSTATSG